LSATLMDGKALAERVRAEVAADAVELGGLGLATLLIGDDEASQIYIRLKQEAAEQAGIRAVDRRLPADVSEEDVLEQIAELNADDTIDGILVQTPVPSHLDEPKLLGAVDPDKDVDGLHPVNAGLLYLGRNRLVPATPLGVMRLLDEYRIPTAGAGAVVVGRSQIVGRPVSMLLLQANATVTICHSQTEDLARASREADILVVAVGLAHLISPDMVKQGATVIDVGMNRSDAGLVGDVDPEVAEVAAYLTPVPGGVGPMTIAMLLHNTVRAARLRRGALASAS
jgi:methylenetetrahydrofolate dehydrogenase (NADP+)/methenyltetrahydrofolate cyclohydrolase